MQPQNSIAENKQIDEAIASLKQKMKLLNYNNLQPPYFLHTLTKFRQTHFCRFLKTAKIEGNDLEDIRKNLENVRYLVQKFDDNCFDLYTSQLIQPYIRKMFQDNYEFNAINFQEVNTQYHLQTQIQETLSEAAEWLSQVQVTQDLLARVQMYFKIKVPSVGQKVRQNGLQSQRNTWMGSFMSGMRKLVSFGLRKGSKMVQSTFFTAVAPAALMLTLAIMGGSVSLPWKTTLNTKNLITSAVVVAIPFLLDTMATEVQKSDYQATLKRWALTFQSLAENIHKFNEILQESIRNCAFAQNASEFQIQRTNLQKIVHQLTKNIENIVNFDEKTFEQMRQRTEAYFRQYVEINQDNWTLVLPKNQQSSSQNISKESTITQTTAESKESFQHL